MQENVKQDSNFLDKPLWFSNPVQKNEVYTWDNGRGYTYKATYKVPTSFDALVLLYLLKKSQKKQEYEQIIYLTEYEILKACGYSTTDSKRYKRVRESLKIWEHIHIEFDGNFYNGYGYSWAVFGILNQATYRKDMKKYQIEFNSLWLQTIQDSRFFQLVNFEYYKALKRPVSRRLFEILCKSFEHSDTWCIKLANLGDKLTLTPHKSRDKIYASDVLVAIKPAIKEINKISSDRELLKKADVKLDQAFIVDYEILGEKQERVIKFVKKEIEIDKVENDNEELNQLLRSTKKTGKRITEAIKIYYGKKGYEYVKRNIEYANEKANKQYSAYLCKALAQDWAVDYLKVNPQDEALKLYENMTDKEKEDLKREALAGKFGIVLQMAIDSKDREHFQSVLILHLIDKKSPTK